MEKVGVISGRTLVERKATVSIMQGKEKTWMERFQSTTSSQGNWGQNKALHVKDLAASANTLLLSPATVPNRQL